MSIIDPKDDISAHLIELVEAKPSSWLKLLAAWDGLSVEVQIKFLYYLRPNLFKAPFLFKEKALQSNNEYVRYLISNFIELDENNPKDLKLLSLISNDTLLANQRKMPNFGGWGLELGMQEDEPGLFFSMPIEWQILKVSAWGLSNLSAFVSLIEWAVNSATLPSTLEIIIEEYIGNLKKISPHDVNYSRDFISDFATWHHEKDLKATWEFLPKLNKLGMGNSAYLMVRNLPLRVHQFGACVVSEDLIKELNNTKQDLLKYLLWREDFSDSDIRKKILFSEKNKFSDEIKSAAASSGVYFTRIEFSKLIQEKNQEVINLLIENNKYHSYLSPLYIFALYDLKKTLLEKRKNKADSTEDLDFNDLNFDKFFQIETKWDKSEEKRHKNIKNHLLELGLYRIAYSVAHKNLTNSEKIEILGDKLSFLLEKIKPLNAWETFVSFRQHIENLNKYAGLLLQEIDDHCFKTFRPSILCNSEELFEEDSSEFLSHKMKLLYKEVSNLSEELKRSKKEFNQRMIYFFVVMAVILYSAMMA